MSEDDLNLIREMANMGLKCSLARWRSAIELMTFCLPDDGAEVALARRTPIYANAWVSRSTSGETPAMLVSAALGVPIDEAEKLRVEAQAQIDKRKAAEAEAAKAQLGDIAEMIK